MERRLDRPMGKRSIFTGARVKPALGQIFDQFLDLHIFIHRLPKSRADAEILYGDAPSLSEDINYAYVCEILKDETPNLDLFLSPQVEGKKRKFGWREEMWVPLLIREDGLGFRDAFAGSGKGTGGGKGVVVNGIDVGGRVEERVGLGVGNVAKVFGFGGRRV
jgi:hypothetical protein